MLDFLAITVFVSAFFFSFPFHFGLEQCMFSCVNEDPSALAIQVDSSHSMYRRMECQIQHTV